MPLTTAQRTYLQQRLLAERARALSVLNRDVPDQADGSQQDEAGDLSQTPFHPADFATDTMNDELDASNDTRISRELAEIDAALERLYQRPNPAGANVRR
jgi:RNA polymerase-binding transcription factor DksA